MLSYELSIGLSILTIVVFAGSMQLSTIVEEQANGWFIFRGHIPALISFVVYLIAGTAETNRGPFDLPEADSELTAGYHTEYSGMQFGFFYLAEYPEHVYRGRCCHYPVLGRMDAAAYSGMGKFQSDHGLHSDHRLVFRESGSHHIYYYVVQMDLPR